MRTIIPRTSNDPDYALVQRGVPTAGHIVVVCFVDVAERLEAGGVGVNVDDVTELAAPFGGWRAWSTAMTSSTTVSD